MAGKSGILGSGAMATTLSMVLQLRCTGVSAGEVWNVCSGAVVTSGAVVNIPDVCRVPVAPAWRVCVGAHLSAAAFLVSYWSRRCSLSTWTCKSVTEDARALMLSRIWSI